MQILDKAITPDGIEIELRDLSGEHKLPDYNGLVIVFRTIAKKTFPPNLGWYAQKGKEFHSCICCYKNYTSDMLKANHIFGMEIEIVMYLGWKGVKVMLKTLKEMLIEAGYPESEMYHPSYGSDLYVYVTPLTTKVIEEWCKAHDYRMAWHCPTFKDQITGKMMYDCAFQWYEN